MSSVCNARFNSEIIFSAITLSSPSASRVRQSASRRLFQFSQPAGDSGFIMMWHDQFSLVNFWHKRGAVRAVIGELEAAETQLGGLWIWCGQEVPEIKSQTQREERLQHFWITQMGNKTQARPEGALWSTLASLIKSSAPVENLDFKWSNSFSHLRHIGSTIISPCLLCWVANKCL